MSNGNPAGDKRSEAGSGSKGSGRRRYFRRRKPAQKTQDAPPKTEPRKVQQEGPPKNRPCNNAKAESPSRNERDRRGGRRRRRRTRGERIEETPPVQESTLAAIEHEYTPPKAVFVYTYVLRPGVATMHEFRPEHFSRVGRRLEDFQIDLSPLFPAEGAAKPAPKPELPADLDDEEPAEFVDDVDEEDKLAE